MTMMPRRAITTMLLATTALVGLGHAAFAQAQPIVLDEIVFEADEDGTLGTAAVSTTSGSKMSIAVTELPQSVSVVTRAQLDALPNSGKLDDALRYSAGVSTNTYGTDADTDWYFIRGFKAEQSGMFLDGLPLYQTGFGTFLTDPFLLDRVEVLKGPASVLYGGANLGGIVNMVGKRPTGERLRYTETGINSFGNAYGAFDIGDGNEEGTLAYRLTGKVSGGGWETDYSEDLRGVVQGSVEFKPTDATSVTVYGNYQNVDLVHTSTGFLPYVGTVVGAPGVGRIPRDLFYGEPATDSYDRQQTMLGYELEHDINGEWTVRQNARYAHVSLAEDYYYGTGDLIGTTLPRYRFVHDTEVSTVSVDNQLEGKFDTGPLEHNVLLGLDYKYYNINALQDYGPGAALDVLNPVYGDNAALVSPSDVTTSMNQLGIYAQDQIRFNRFITTLNGRYDWLGIDVDNALLPATSTSAETGNFSGRVGLGYEFDNGVTPYVSYSTSFNPTLSTDSSGNLFEPETGVQWEAGIKWEPDFIDGLITASFFDLTRDNVVGPDPLVPGASAAVGEVNVRGFEIEAQAKVTSDLTLIGALTYLDAEVITSTGPSWAATPAGNTPVQIPDLTASLWLDYKIPEGLLQGVSLGAGVRYVGESWADGANTLKVPGATLVDAAVRYDQEDWGVALKVSNIFDNQYVSSCDSPTSCGYGAGRTATLTLHKSW